MLMISADARFSEMDRLEFRTDTLVVLNDPGRLHSAGDQWRRRGVRKIPQSGPGERSPKKQRNDQADTAKHGNRLVRLDTQSGFGRMGMYSCSRSQAWAWRKSLPASHRLLRNTARVMCGLTPEMTARRYRKISARVTIETCRIFAGRAPARRQVRCSPAAIAAPRKLLLPPAC